MQVLQGKCKTTATSLIFPLTQLGNWYLMIWSLMNKIRMSKDRNRMEQIMRSIWFFNSSITNPGSNQIVHGIYGHPILFLLLIVQNK